MSFLKRFLIRRKFRYGYYSLHKVKLSDYGKNELGNACTPKVEEINGFNRKLSEIESAMYDSIPITCFTEFDGVMNINHTNEIFAIFQSGLDTGIRLSWCSSRSYSRPEKSINAIDLQNRQFYPYESMTIYGLRYPTDFAAELILNRYNQDVWCRKED